MKKIIIFSALGIVILTLSILSIVWKIDDIKIVNEKYESVKKANEQYIDLFPEQEYIYLENLQESIKQYNKDILRGSIFLATIIISSTAAICFSTINIIKVCKKKNY